MAESGNPQERERASERPYIVTGGSGFIGRHLIRHLVNSGERVVALSRADDWEDAIKTASTVFHLAAVTRDNGDNPAELIQLNSSMTARVLEAIRKTNPSCRIVLASSSACYGAASIFPTPESAPLRPCTAYGLSKVISEEYVRLWHQIFGIWGVSLRLYHVYGPPLDKAWRATGPVECFMAARNQNMPLELQFDGEERRDFVHVDDVVKALIAAADLGKPGESYNIGTGQTISIRELAGLVGGPVRASSTESAPVPVMQADIRKAGQELQWSPTVSVEAGVRSLLL